MGRFDGAGPDARPDRQAHSINLIDMISNNTGPRSIKEFGLRMSWAFQDLEHFAKLEKCHSAAGRMLTYPRKR